MKKFFKKVDNLLNEWADIFFGDEAESNGVVERLKVKFEKVLRYF